MRPYSEIFPEGTPLEIRNLIVLPRQRIPAGKYRILELYCDEPRCDCRRVILLVSSDDRDEPPRASINFGWEPKEFYAKWCGDPDFAEEMASATIEPFAPQSHHAEDFLELVKQAVKDRCTWHG